MTLAGINPLGTAPSLELYQDANWVKEQLPLEWVLGHLWGLWGLGSHKVRCPSPTHNDSTPSFNLWKPDSAGRYMKFGCYGCDLRGDVLDAIQIQANVSYMEALELAATKLVPEYQKSGYLPQVDSRPAVSRDEVKASYLELLELSYDLAPVVRFLNEKGMLEILPYQEKWRVRGHRLINGVSFPHYAADGTLTGVKFRDRSKMEKKWGIRGSQFPYLYGAWRDTGKLNVVLCEGETDTIWAAWQLRDRNCDVFGLPTGALQTPTEQQLAQLEGRDVWLAFDGDAAGNRAREIWMERLARGHNVDVPIDHDLLSCGIPIWNLLCTSGRT